MKGCETVSVSPDHPSIYYEVKCCSTNEEDLHSLVDSLWAERNKDNHVSSIPGHLKELWICMHTFYIEANIYFQTDIISDRRRQRSKHDSSNCARSSEQQDMLALGEFLIPENNVVCRDRKVNCSKSRGGEILLLRHAYLKPRGWSSSVVESGS